MRSVLAVQIALLAATASTWAVGEHMLGAVLSMGAAGVGFGAYLARCER